VSIGIDVLYDVSTVSSNPGVNLGTFFLKFCPFKMVSRMYE
jgi:hypothetical protein